MKFIATIYFNGDRSVGISPRWYCMDLDENLKQVFDEDKEYREEIRKKILDLYIELDGDERPVVYFSDENI